MKERHYKSLPGIPVLLVVIGFAIYCSGSWYIFWNKRQCGGDFIEHLPSSIGLYIFIFRPLQS